MNSANRNAFWAWRARHALATRARRWRSICTIVLVGAGPGAVPSTILAAPPVPTEVVTFELRPHYFDGLNLDVVVFRSASLELQTDTLGAWTPDESHKAGAGFRLRHRRHDSVTLALYPFSGAGDLMRPDGWTSYARAVQGHLGTETRVQHHGTAGAPGSVPALGAWPTRELRLHVPATATAPARGEHHVVASDDARGIILILAGPESALADCAQDFHFFLARMQVRANSK